MSLVNKYRLERRLNVLEKLIVERSIGKNGEPSKAYRIWDYLMNNGPTSVVDLKQALPDDITRAINFFAKNDILVKDGNMVSANADYVWDDVGVIPRTAEQEVLNDIGNKLNSTSTDSSDSPTPTRRRAVKANLFSRKLEEVKAAIDAGQDVNHINDKAQTPLLYACGATKADTGPIVELLLENGADPTITSNNNPNQCLFLAVKNDNRSAVAALALDGIDLHGYYKNYNTYLYQIITTRMLDEATFSKVLDKHFSSNTGLYVSDSFYMLLRRSYEVYGTNIVNKMLNICFSTGGKGYSLNQFLSTLPYIGYDNRQADLLAEILEVCISHGVVPSVAKGDFSFWDDNKYISKKLFDTVNDVVSGKLELYDSSNEYFSVIAYISDKYGWSISNIADILTQSFINSQPAIWGWSLIRDAKESDKIKLLRKFNFKRLTHIDFNRYILLLFEINNKELTRAIFKQTRSYIIDEIDYLLSNNLDKYVTRISNRYFFEYLLDLDDSDYIGNKLAHLLYLRGHSKYNTTSKTCIDALTEAGYDLNKDTFNDNKSKYNDSLIKDIINNIYDDTMSANTRRTIEADPSIIADSKIQNALKEVGDDNVTARQLKVIYDRWAATVEKDKYDM